MPKSRFMPGTIWKGIAAGALGGLAGSFAMNQFQSVWSKASKALSSEEPKQQQSSGGNEDKSEDATVKTAEAISCALFEHKLSSDEKKWAGPAVHYGFGTLVGATYGALAAKAPAVSSGRGTAYGGAVWLIGDEVAVPSFGLSQPPDESPLSSHVNALAAHLVYGFVTDLVVRTITD